MTQKNIINDIVIEMHNTESINTDDILYNDKIKNKIVNIYYDFKLNHGIKPKIDEVITINDSYNSMISKFDSWYNRALLFSQGGQMDQLGFLKLINNFERDIYSSFKGSSIEDNIFIEHMLDRTNIKKKNIKF